MKILLVNDDGYTADGLVLLEDALRAVFDEEEDFQYNLFAPANNCSGMSRAITLKNPVRVEQIVNRFKVHGTPADCVEIACRLGRFDLCLSGVNLGNNFGLDCDLSGTLQAAMHAWTYFGVPAVAISMNENASRDDIRAELFSDLKLIIENKHKKGVIGINYPYFGYQGKKIALQGERKRIGRLLDHPQRIDLQPEGHSLKKEFEVNLANRSTLLQDRDQMDYDSCVIDQGFTAVTLYHGAKRFW